MKPEEAMKKAVAAVGTVKLANTLGITSQAVSQWKTVPIKHVRKVSEVSGVSPELLAPEIFAGSLKAK